MHIAWLGKKTPFCGNVTYSLEVTRSLRDRGHQVSFLHFDLERESETEVALPYLYKSTIYTLPTLRSSKVLINALQELRPDLVHASLALSPLDFTLPEICHDLGIPLVATFHLPFDAKRRNLTSSTQQFTYQIYAPALAEYDQVIVFSDLQKDLLHRLGVPIDRLTVIPNGVDPDRYSPGPSSIKQELQCERLFLFQGRLAVEKNVESLLRAWQRLVFSNQYKLAIVGDGPLAPLLKAAYGNCSNIVWMGYIGNEQRRIEILRGTDVFILPSLVEGLSLSLLEAMSCGVACLATDVGADGEVVSGGAGIALDSTNVVSQLTTLLPLFIDHPELSVIIGRKARQRVLERYTLSQNINQLENLYRRILQQYSVPLASP
ncbi:MAG: glycosyltransferase family 4 protein [Pseudanabaenaceae cyanobacterium SKYGB_i_bin29]|nr:glycosyltransferase family 4 protein [Pseudanabaenaceae cyanobacterium SKYG29]MDW8420623.1 glycosyltransferase family 4 protein [Pseudanabaenaceae cyanobacterium SKYGB_i_bin29]